MWCRSYLNASCFPKYYISDNLIIASIQLQCMKVSNVPSPSHNCRVLRGWVSPLPPEWVCWGDCVLFQWHTDWVIYVLLSARQRLLLGKSKRRATASLFSPDQMMSGLSAPSFKLGARHPSCWSKSHRDPIGCEPQLDADWAVVATGLMRIRTADRNGSTYPLLPVLFIVLVQHFRTQFKRQTCEDFFCCCCLLHLDHFIHV